jgi:hypothetical protein
MAGTGETGVSTGGSATQPATGGEKGQASGAGATNVEKVGDPTKDMSSSNKENMSSKK